MNARIFGSGMRSCLYVCALLSGLLMAAPAQAVVDKSASIEASGEAVIFDVRATADGILRVGTQAGRVGDRWRVSIVQANKATGVVSAVGTGATNLFTGIASRSVAANVQYVVLVTYDRPLPGTFPAKVTVRFAGETDLTDPPVAQLNGGALANIVPRAIKWVEPPLAGCPGDNADIGCEQLIACEFNPAGDIDNYTLGLPANSDVAINISGPFGSRWKLIDPDGVAVNPTGCAGLCVVGLTKEGIYKVRAYNIEKSTGTYRISLLGVSTPYRCGVTLTAGAEAYSADFTRSGDTDSYNLNNVLAGETYSIQVVGPDGTIWKIFDPDGNLINADGCNGQCDVTLPVAGDYTIMVYSLANKTGNYTISAVKVGS